MKGTRRFLVAVTAMAATACIDPWEPPEADLDARNLALDEVIDQTEVIRTGTIKDASARLLHEDWRVRRAAALRLAREPDDAVAHVPALIEALSDDHPRVRTAAARALGEIGDARSFDALIAAMVDPEPEVRHWSWKALVKIGEPAYPRLIFYLGKDAPELPMFEEENGSRLHIRNELRRVLPELGKPIIPFLAEGTGDKDSLRNVNCVRVLRDIGEGAADAIPALVEHLEKSSYLELRLQCIRALEAIGDVDPLVVPALKKASEDPSREVAKRARQCMVNMEKKAAKELKDKKKKDKKGKKNKASKKKLPPKPAPPKM